MSKQPTSKSKNCYSDEELANFKIMIEEKLEEAKVQLGELKDQLRELNESEDTTRAGTFEGGAFNQQREHVNKLAARQQKFIRNLEYALIRIRNKTYGVCSVTGDLIDKKRLMLVPHATKSIEGKHSSQGRAKRVQKPLREHDF